MATKEELQRARAALEASIEGPRLSDDRMASLVEKALDRLEQNQQANSELISMLKGKSPVDGNAARRVGSPLGGELPNGDTGEKVRSTGIEDPSFGGTTTKALDAEAKRGAHKLDTSESDPDGTVTTGDEDSRGVSGDDAAIKRNRKGKIAKDQPRGNAEGVRRLNSSESDPDGTVTTSNPENVVRPDGKVHKALPPRDAPEDDEDEAEAEAEEEAREAAEDRGADRRKRAAGADDDDEDGDGEPDDDEGEDMGKALTPQEFVELLAKGERAPAFEKVVDGSEALAHLTEVVGTLTTGLSRQLAETRALLKSLRAEMDTVTQSQLSLMKGLSNVIDEQRTLAKSFGERAAEVEQLAKSVPVDEPPTGIYFSGAELAARNRLRKAKAPVDSGTGEASINEALTKAYVLRTLEKAHAAGLLQTGQMMEYLPRVDGATGPAGVWSLLSDDIKALA